MEAMSEGGADQLSSLASSTQDNQSRNPLLCQPPRREGAVAVVGMACKRKEGATRG